MSKTCVVAVPIYKKCFSHDEEQCVKKYATVLSEEKLIFICPESLDKSYYKEQFPTFDYESFQDKYFKCIAGYNKLMLSESFYGRFDNYEYILIAQPDAVIWREENMLRYFMDKDFDYYGAPWIPERRILEWTWVTDNNGKRIECAKKKDHGIVMGNLLVDFLSLFRCHLFYEFCRNAGPKLAFANLSVAKHQSAGSHNSACAYHGSVKHRCAHTYKGVVFNLGTVNCDIVPHRYIISNLNG